MPISRKYPIGAEVLPQGGVHFRVWADNSRRVEVVLEDGGAPSAVVLEPEPNGYFSGIAANATAGTRYRYRLDGGSELYPDPASRFQPQGPHGPSQVVDPTAFAWTDAAWPGVELRGQIIYEMHLGTFTPEGTWRSAMGQLNELAAAGITVLEVMPVADFAGEFGWGYDGVDLFAPTRLYGEPDDFRRFVDAAHGAGMGVILDVVYNHFGPDGNYWSNFSRHYHTDRHPNEWGQAINFDGEKSGPVREFFAANAAYWIDEYHLDGLRLDATQQIFDSSPESILTVIGQRVRSAARGRKTFIVAENEAQHSHIVRPVEEKGNGLDGLWNDDLHHAVRVALTGHNQAYYTDYRGTPQELISALKWGFLYQGQWYKWQKQRRGVPALDIPPHRFVTFLENHDQIANSGTGLRLRQLTSPGRLRAMTAVLLLGPGTPMLFQGQEFGASNRFVFFADHHPELAQLVRQGRARFLAQFPDLASPEAQAQMADPADRRTFESCKLDLGERDRHGEIFRLHRDLIRLRREDPVFGAQRPRGMDGAVLGELCFLLRFFAEDGADRLLLVNLGRDRHLIPAPEPLFAPPAGCQWAVLWSSESPDYGGPGMPAWKNDESCACPGESAIAFAPQII